MKGLIIILSVALLAVLALVPQANASANLTVNASVPTGTLLQGQVTAADLSVKNNENFPVRIYKIGVHYDWMAEGTFYELDLGNSYVQIESNMAGMPGQVLLSCDRNASVGYHQYYFRLDITRYNTLTATWDHGVTIGPVAHIYVDSPYRQQALTLLQAANDTLAAAKALSYSGKDAKADLVNATDSLNGGWSAYNANSFLDAMDAAARVTLSVNHAKTADREYMASLNATRARIAMVNDKLAVLSGSGSTQVKSLVNQSVSHLRQAEIYVSAEDWARAGDQIIVADGTADRALNAQFMYQQNASDIDVSRAEALDAISIARDVVGTAGGLTSAAANSLLRDAGDRLEAAIVSFNHTVYRNATREANVAEALAWQAMKADADYRMQQAREKISLAGTLKSPDANMELNESRKAYNDSVSDYARENYRGAIDNASRAFTLANNTSVTEKLWKQQHPLNSVVPGFEAVICLTALLMISYFYRRREQR